MHSVKHKAMDKSTTGNGKQVRYQRDMEKSFAVIYHNLRRIKEDRQSQDRWAKRRSHSEPQLHAHNPALLTKYEPTPNRERSRYTATSKSPDPKDYKRKVSFSDNVN